MGFEEIGRQGAAEGMTYQNETLRYLQYFKRCFDIRHQFGHIVAGAFGFGGGIRVAVPPQVQGNHPVFRLKLLQLVLPIGCPASKTVDEHQGLRLRREHRYRSRSPPMHFHPPVDWGADGIAVEVDIESHGRIVANILRRPMCYWLNASR